MDLPTAWRIGGGSVDSECCLDLDTDVDVECSWPWADVPTTNTEHLLVTYVAFAAVVAIVVA